MRGRWKAKCKAGAGALDIELAAPLLFIGRVAVGGLRV